MSIITIANINQSFGGLEILKNISFSIEPESRIGIVGKNGCGKSTLMNIITGKMEALSGDIHIAKGKKLVYLEQSFTLDENVTLFEEIYESHQDLLSIQNDIHDVQHKMQTDHSDKLMKRLNDLQGRFEMIGGYTYESQVKNVLTHLGFAPEVWSQKIGVFSGGEKTRIQLAKILLKPYDVLFLDEPTNHLDFAMIYWLENYLRNLQKPYVVISHDRSFLDKTVNQIIEIEHKTTQKYSGNYSFYLQESALRKEQQAKAFSQQQKFIEKTEDFIRKNMAGQKVKQAKSRLKMLDKLDRVDNVTTSKNINLKMKTTDRSGNEVLIVDKMKLTIGNKDLANNVDLLLKYQDRVVLAGKNGCGKTTFLRAIQGEHSLASGSIRIGSRVTVGYYDQMHISLDGSKTVLDTIWAKMPGEPIGQPLSYLARFGFRGEENESKVFTLSGGEKARLYLACLILDQPNFLLLDEPTNHLDIAMIESLEDALKSYEGTILFVSHDRYFIEKIANKVWYFDQQKILEREVDLQKLFVEKKEAKKEKVVNQKSAPKKQKVNPIKIEMLLNEIEEIQTKIDILNESLEEKNLELAKPEVYSDSDKIKNINQEITKISNEISTNTETLDEKEMLYLEWTDDE